MLHDPPPEIGVEQIDAVLKFLPRFEEQGYQFGQWRAPAGYLPYFSFSSEAQAFIRALYEQRIIIAFDWQSWREQAQYYQAHMDALETADLLTVRKLLTTHVRMDRFVEGYLASLFDQGLLTTILWRLKRIRDQMADSETLSP
jgi:hypothetical protein